MHLNLHYQYGRYPLRLWGLVIFLCGAIWCSSAQSPYILDVEQEFTYTAFGGSAFFLARYMKSRTKLFTSDQLESLDARAVPPIDRGATRWNSLTARETSDVFMIGSHVLPALFLTARKTRHDFEEIAILWGEVMIINTGLTQLSKYTFRRARPYVYNPETRAADIQTQTARAAFISGHTSATAANCFFFAKVFSDYYPDSKLKPIVWTAAASIPALTGYLRVKSGRHFPSDVVAGYALGACVGYFIPHLHKNVSPGERQVRMSTGINSLHLRLVF